MRNGLILYSRPKNRQKAGSAHCLRARCPHPGRNLSLGQQSRAGALGRLGRESARASVAVGFIGRLRAVFGRTKIAAGRVLPNPNLIRLFPFSLFFAALSHLSSAAAASRNRERKSDERAVLCAIAGHLAGAHAPQQVSTPPSSGLAAVLPWPSLASPRPRLSFFSRADEKFHPMHPNPTPTFPFLSLSCSFRVYPNGEKTRVRVRVCSCRFGLGFVLTDSFSLLLISFFSFIRMENLGLGLGFRPFFLSSSPFLSFGFVSTVLGIRPSPFPFFRFDLGN